MNPIIPPATNHIAAVPLFYWRGAHPFPLTLTADDTGDASILVLGREGDICLMPLTWEQNLPAPFDPSPLAFHADSVLDLRDVAVDAVRDADPELSPVSQGSQDLVRGHVDQPEGVVTILRPGALLDILRSAGH